MTFLQRIAGFSLFLVFSGLKAQGIEIPQVFKYENPIKHLAYTTSYSHEFGQPHWVAYQLDKSKLIKVASRPSRFKPDPKITPPTTSHNTYTKTGYDRGHLAPAADMVWSTQTMLQSFYTSNICPQAPGFNRGIWKNLETLVRNWATNNNSIQNNPQLFIVTGPVFTENMPNISREARHNLMVPSYFFKAVVDTSGVKRGIGFLIPNQKIPNEQLWNFAMTIDELESKIGRDLFPGLPDEMETAIEAAYIRKDWE